VFLLSGITMYSRVWRVGAGSEDWSACKRPPVCHLLEATIEYKAGRPMKVLAATLLAV